MITPAPVRLSPNWRTILRRAWSVRFTALSLIFTAAEVAMPLLTPADLGIPPLAFAMVAGLCSALALLSRLVAQKGITHADHS